MQFSWIEKSDEKIRQVNAFAHRTIFRMDSQVSHMLQSFFQIPVSGYVPWLTLQNRLLEDRFKSAPRSKIVFRTAAICPKRKENENSVTVSCG